MKKLLWVLFACLSAFSAFSQAGFENGYLINDKGEKINCLIRNRDWGYNPKSIRYKLGPDASVQTATIEHISEFGVGTTHKYKRFVVEYDQSVEEISKLRMERDPINILDTVFLKVLVEGKSSLYIYENGEVRRFFIQSGNGPAEQLVYKFYLTPAGQVSVNDSYKHQMASLLTCENSPSVTDLKYETKELSRAVRAHNSCNGGTVTDYSTRHLKSSFQLSVRPGVRISTFNATGTPSSPLGTDPRKYNFEDKVAVRFGVEAEFVLPLHKTKWSILIEPTYQYYKANSTSPDQSTLVDYESIELPISARYTFNPSSPTTVFLNLGYCPDLEMNSKINFANDPDLEIKTGSNFVAGGGIRFKSKFTCELRVNGGRSLLQTYSFWRSNFSSASLIVGYRFH
jgi:Outer membrane protein beta-barrel domain